MAEPTAVRARIPLALIALGVRRPKAVLLSWLVLAALAIPGLMNLQVDTSTDSVLDRKHPAWQVYQASLEDFGGDEIIVVALRAVQPYAAPVLRKL
ncbi:MAG: hypothetical protein NZ990_19565, partial [Myxococcota bacterium]|nr:hypothetical protein [Myxococcota bacterium]